MRTWPRAWVALSISEEIDNPLVRRGRLYHRIGARTVGDRLRWKAYSTWEGRIFISTAGKLFDGVDKSGLLETWRLAWPSSPSIRRGTEQWLCDRFDSISEHIFYHFKWEHIDFCLASIWVHASADGCYDQDSAMFGFVLQQPILSMHIFSNIGSRRSGATLQPFTKWKRLASSMYEWLWPRSH